MTGPKIGQHEFPRAQNVKDAPWRPEEGCQGAPSRGEEQSRGEGYGLAIPVWSDVKSSMLRSCVTAILFFTVRILAIGRSSTRGT